MNEYNFARWSSVSWRCVNLLKRVTDAYCQQRRKQHNLLRNASARCYYEVLAAANIP